MSINGARTTMSATIEYLNLAGTLKRSLGATQVPGLGAPELQCSGSTQLCLCLQCAGGTGAAGIPDLLPLASTVPLAANDFCLQQMAQPAHSQPCLALPGSLTAGKWNCDLCTLLENGTFKISLNLRLYRKVCLCTPN